MSYKRDSYSDYAYDSYSRTHYDGYSTGYTEKRYDAYEEYKKSETGYKKKGYYYYVQSFISGDKKYEKVFKATCLASLSSAKKIYSPKLSVRLDENDKAYCNLKTDSIFIGKQFINKMEKKLRDYCEDKGISYNSKRALIDIFKLVYCHELTHIKYSKRLSVDAEKLKDIESLPDELFTALLPDDRVAFDDRHMILFKRDILNSLIIQLVNCFEDVFVNKKVLSYEYKNQYFDDIVDMTIKNITSSEKMRRTIDAGLVEFDKKEIKTIDDLCKKIPTQIDFIMFVLELLKKTEYKVSDDDIRDYELEELLKSLILPKAQARKAAERMKRRKIDDALERRQLIKADTKLIKPLQTDIMKHKGRIVRDETKGVLR